jgi:hypothetical protein
MGITIFSSYLQKIAGVHFRHLCHFLIYWCKMRGQVRTGKQTEQIYILLNWKGIREC